MEHGRSLCILLPAILLITSSSSARDPHENRGHIETGDLVISWQQGTIGDVIIEKDYLVLVYDRDSGFLLETKEHRRDDLPTSFTVSVSREEAGATAGGMVLSSHLYLISPDSDVFPLDPVPRDPCWIARSSIGGEIVVTVVDAGSGAVLGYGIPPPASSLSISGPIFSSPCSGSWDAWYLNATDWFETMGYACQAVAWPTRGEVSSSIAGVSTALFYEIAHGGSYSFASGCEGDESFEFITVEDVSEWISHYTKMPFSFLASCGAMCDTGEGSMSHALRRGSNSRTSTVGYCGMAQENCDLCWTYSLDWQDALFGYMAEGWTVREAYDMAVADFPMCQECVGFAGDEGFAGPFDRNLLCPSGLLCSEQPGAALLEWMNEDDYDWIGVYRNHEQVTVLDGGETSFLDILPHPGHYVYEVSGCIGNVESEYSSCVVDAGSRSRSVPGIPVRTGAGVPERSGSVGSDLLAAEPSPEQPTNPHRRVTVP